MSELYKKLLDIGGFCSKTQDLKPIKSVAPEAVSVKSTLQQIINLIKTSLPEEMLKDLDFFYSRGAIFYPKVPWISITRSGHLPKRNLSTTICFARNGEGLVFGVLLPSMRVMDFETVNRTNNKKYINVNGTNTPTKYNNNFVNPLDIYFCDYSEIAFLDHIIKSIKLMKSLES